MRRLPLLFALVFVLLLPLAGPAQDKEHAKTWDDAVDKAIKYCRKSQDKDGSWGGKVSPGITGLVLAVLLKTGKLDKDDPALDYPKIEDGVRGMAFIEAVVKSSKANARWTKLGG